MEQTYTVTLRSCGRVWHTYYDLRFRDVETIITNWLDGFECITISPNIKETVS